MSADSKAFYTVAEYVDELTYKPGTKFDLWRVPGGTAIGVSREVPDARNPEGKPVLFMQSTVLRDALVDRHASGAIGYIRHHLLALIIEMETHEAREWFKYGGQLLDDPHQKSEELHSYALHHRREGFTRS